MEPIDRDYFEANFPASLGAGLTQKRKVGCRAIFDAWDALPVLDNLDWLAYMLGTAWHETQRSMQPVRETFAATDAQAVANVTAYCAEQGIANYAKRDANGNSYYGRGFVQLTHATNYTKASQKLGLGSGLYDNPDLALTAGVAAQVLAHGLVEGWFRPAAGTLQTYFNSTTKDWYNARGLVNGDKAHIDAWTRAQWPGGRSNGQLIADYAQALRGALAT